MERHIQIVFSVSELEAAINCWREMFPATGDEGSLSTEVNVLAGLYARVIYEKWSEIPSEQLSSDELKLIEIF